MYDFLGHKIIKQLLSLDTRGQSAVLGIIRFALAAKAAHSQVIGVINILTARETKTRSEKEVLDIEG
jgi:hypothetical protein